MRLGTVRITGGAARVVGKVAGHDELIDVAEAVADFGLMSAEFPHSLKQVLEFSPYSQPVIDDLEAAVVKRGDLGSAPWSLREGAVTFLAPIPKPGMVVCVGGNRKGSLTRPLLPEIQDEWPRPMYFSKLVSAVSGHGATVEAWSAMRPVHTEGEVCLFIGRRARHVAPQDAWSHVAGIGLLNDMFAGRFVQQDGTTLQIKTSKTSDVRDPMITRQMIRSKSPDGMCPIGPFMVPPKDLTRPFAEINVVTTVGANVVQKGVVDDYEFTVERTISEITKWITLEAGDVVSLGAFAHQPDFPLRSVDLAAPENRVVRIEADDLGVLETHLRLVDE